VKKYFLAVFACLLAVLSTAATESKSDDRIVLTKDNTVVMDAEYTEKSVAEVGLKARELDSRLPSGDPIYLVIDSGGGSIEAGLSLIENLRALNRPVHTVTLFSASMAFQTVQGLGTRYITESGTLMAHKAKGQFEGEFPGQFDSRYQYYLKRILKLDERVVARSNGKLTLDKFRQLYANEMWCEGQECVDLSVADKVVSVACDKSLDGTREANLELSFMGMPIQVTLKKAACPTITGVLDVKAKVKGQLVDFNNANEWKANPVLKTMTVEEIKALQHFVENSVEGYTSAARTVKPY
jgi:ATP-dependent protease ClpP protease subunit